MSVVTTQFVKKPIHVDAVRVSKDNFTEVAAWCLGEIKHDESRGKEFIRVRANNPINSRQTKAFVGDWILYTERGYKVYTNKAFRLSFDEVQPKTEPQEAPGDFVMGSEEIMPGVTLNDAVAWLRQQPEESRGHIRDTINSGGCVKELSVKAA